MRKDPLQLKTKKKLQVGGQIHDIIKYPTPPPGGQPTKLEKNYTAEVCPQE